MAGIDDDACLVIGTAGNRKAWKGMIADDEGAAGDQNTPANQPMKSIVVHWHRSVCRRGGKKSVLQASVHELDICRL